MPTTIRIVLNEEKEINVTIQKVLEFVERVLYANRLSKNR
jgi:hypothetical protein